MQLIIADDHPMLLDGLGSLLEKIEGIEVIAKVLNGRELIDSLQFHTPDLILLDLNMPNINGIESLKFLRQNYPMMKVVIISSYYQPELIREIRDLGARGFMPKSCSVQELREAIETVMGGQLWFQEQNSQVSDISPFFIDNFMKKYQLTKREVEIIRMITSGLTSKEISEKLFVSEFTINAHRRNISRKLNIHSPVGLLNFAKEQGLA
ncbi:MAG: response regulator transcription factor [Bacteroidota bacterium]|nr:response regulator transcription factor [Bacteroidota bacterium]